MTQNLKDSESAQALIRRLSAALRKPGISRRAVFGDPPTAGASMRTRSTRPMYPGSCASLRMARRWSAASSRAGSARAAPNSPGR